MATTLGPLLTKLLKTNPGPRSQVTASKLAQQGYDPQEVMSLFGLDTRSGWTLNPEGTWTPAPGAGPTVTPQGEEVGPGRPSFDAGYMAQVNGGTAQEWTDFRDQVMRTPAPSAAQRQETLLAFENQNSVDMARMKAWTASGGSGYPPMDWVPPGWSGAQAMPGLAANAPTLYGQNANGTGPQPFGAIPPGTPTSTIPGPDGPLTVPLGVGQAYAGRAIEQGGAERAFAKAGLPILSAQAQRRMIPEEFDVYQELGRLSGIGEGTLNKGFRSTLPGAGRTGRLTFSPTQSPLAWG